MNAMTFWVACFGNNWIRRHDPKPEWRRIHRAKARQAVAELRYLTGRQRKAFGPSGYGHQ